MWRWIAKEKKMRTRIRMSTGTRRGTRNSELKSWHCKEFKTPRNRNSRFQHRKRVSVNREPPPAIRLLVSSSSHRLCRVTDGIPFSDAIARQSHPQVRYSTSDSKLQTGLIRVESVSRFGESGTSDKVGVKEDGHGWAVD